MAELKARAALDEDPGFASAHVLLAWSIRGKDPKGAVAAAKRAVELSANTTERERYVILGRRSPAEQPHGELPGRAGTGGLDCEPTRALPYANRALTIVKPENDSWAKLYRRVGREREAEAINAELLKLLEHADPDFPLLEDLTARPAAADSAQQARR